MEGATVEGGMVGGELPVTSSMQAEDRKMWLKNAG